MKAVRRGGPLRVRRSPHLIAYWRGARLMIRNYATGSTTRAGPLVCELLDVCSEWQTAEALEQALPRTPPSLIGALIARLIERSLLERSDRPQDPRVRAMTALDRWNPEAGFFHTATKDVRFWSPQETARQGRVRDRERRMPPPQKRYRGAVRIDLPPPADGAFAQLARARRTWRRFSKASVSREDLATVLGLSVGVQKWARIGERDVPLKTSPSGGARHPLEAYVVVRDVGGVAAGIYHYAADRHALERLRRGATAGRIREYLPHSGYFSRTSALVLFTAVFERQVWRYPYSRAYRAALVEAGHVCQTFCLAATALGLASFPIMGLADSAIERDLGIDGIGESVLYAAGVGRPPRGAAWAPLPRGHLATRDNPRLRPR